MELKALTQTILVEDLGRNATEPDPSFSYAGTRQLHRNYQDPTAGCFQCNASLICIFWAAA